MLKFIAIFVLAMGAGLGISSYLAVQDGVPSMVPSGAGPSAIPVSSSTLQPIGPQTTNNFVENCEGRCRCDSYNVTETVATPGIVTASAEFDVPLKQTPRCPASGGAQFGVKVPGQSGQCFVCPNGMTYSGLLRQGDEIIRRWGFSRHVCVVSKRVCQ